MSKRFFAIAVLSVMTLGVLASPIQADFILCPGGPGCNGSDFSDVIMGSPDIDLIFGQPGDDVIFGDDGNDLISGDTDTAGGDANKDVLFGGLGSDLLQGRPGDDVLLAGPDVAGFGQGMDGEEGNDNFHVLVGEVTECLIIFGGTGIDVVNLIGFGPYSSSGPFGPEGFTDGWVHVIDPVTGGDIFIAVVETGDGATEVINGLLSANPTFLIGTDPNEVIACDDTLPDFT